MRAADAKEMFSSATSPALNSELSSFAPEGGNPTSIAAQAPKTKPVLSFVIPIFNDARFAEPFCVEVLRVLTAYFETNTLDDLIEIIFVDDGSSNDSVDQLKKLALKHRFVKVVELSRNFGHHVAMSCGFKFSSGDYVTSFDVDMQDPPSELPRLLDHIRKGNCDVVQGIRRLRSDSYLKQITSVGFVWLFNTIARVDVPQNCSAMRVMNRKYIDAFNCYTEKVRYALGLEYWLGFKREHVEIGHSERPDGTSSYSLKKRAALALDAIISFSDVPLRLGIYTGCTFAMAGFLLGVCFVIVKLLYPSVMPGFTSIIAVLLFSQGVILMMLGITGLYIGRILKEVQNRPLFVVRNTYNF